jgi:ribosomal protein S18 acetylase RimI-like enzyme
MADVQPAAAVVLIEVARPGADADTVRDLFLEYGETLGFNTCFAGLERELDTLPGDYGPPRGCLLLARAGGAAAGCVGVRPLDESRCEMKRLYVRPQFRRTRLGRKLAEAAIARARDIGYRSMVLDTLPTMREARTLYAALGFKACPPYYDNSLLGSDCFELCF